MARTLLNTVSKMPTNPQGSFSQGLQIGGGIANSFLQPYYEAQANKRANQQLQMQMRAHQDALMQNQIENQLRARDFDMRLRQNTLANAQAGVQPISQFQQQGPTPQGSPLTGLTPGTIDLGNGQAYNPQQAFQTSLQRKTQEQSVLDSLAMAKWKQEEAVREQQRQARLDEPRFDSGYIVQRTPAPSPEGVVGPPGTFGYDFSAKPVPGYPLGQKGTFQLKDGQTLNTITGALGGYPTLIVTQKQLFDMEYKKSIAPLDAQIKQTQKMQAADPNNETIAVDLINLQKRRANAVRALEGKVSGASTTGSAQEEKAYNTLEEAQAAGQNGELEPGDEVIIDGQTYRWEEE